MKSPVFSQLVAGAKVGRGPVIGLNGDAILGSHRGVDLGVSKGTPISAISDGTVVYVGSRDDYGNVVVIRHELPNGKTVYSLSAHMDQPPLVKAGDVVTAATKLGVAGSTGRSTGSHLHFELVESQPGQGGPIDKEGKLSGYFDYKVLDSKLNPYGLLDWNSAKINRRDLTSAERLDQIKLTDSEFQAYKVRVATLESGVGVSGFLISNQDGAEIKYNTNTGNGAYGAYQMRVPALTEAGLLDVGGNWTSFAKSLGVASYADFVASPAAQDVALKIFTEKNAAYIVSKNLGKLCITPRHVSKA